MKAEPRHGDPQGGCQAARAAVNMPTLHTDSAVIGCFLELSSFVFLTQVLSVTTSAVTASVFYETTGQCQASPRPCWAPRCRK